MKTMLDDLCHAAKRQGGTIHQYFPQGFVNDVARMHDAHYHLAQCGITFPSKASLDKLAAQYHLSIKWD